MPLTVYRIGSGFYSYLHIVQPNDISNPVFTISLWFKKNSSNLLPMPKLLICAWIVNTFTEGILICSERIAQDLLSDYKGKDNEDVANVSK